MKLSSVILQISFLIIFAKMMAFGFLKPEERTCKHLRVEKLFKIRCYDMNLKDVPRNLKSSVEEIDLSNNALMTIPLELLQLPSMRNLYIDSNDLTFLENDLEALVTPIKAPLEYLNVADCGLQDIPNLGILPKLWHVNASQNPLRDLTIDRFAYYCNLKSVDLTRTDIPQCQCQQVNNHLRSLAVKTKYVPVCQELLDTSICPLPYNITIDSDTFKSCKNTIEMAEARSLWTLIVGCLGALIAVILYIICFYAAKGKWPFIPPFMQTRVDVAARTLFTQNDTFIKQFCQKWIQVKECFRPIFSLTTTASSGDVISISNQRCQCANLVATDAPVPVVYFDRDHIGNISVETISNTIEFLQNFLPPPTKKSKRKNRVRSRVDEMEIE